MLTRFIVGLALCAVLFVANLFIGSVSIPPGEVLEALRGGGDGDSPLTFIILGSRLPQAVTAMLAGAGLTVSGLMLQTAFRNPLAGPSILGVTSGASLGVALVMLMFGGTLGAAGGVWSGHVAVIAGALAGSVAVLGLLILFSAWLRSDLMLLITGIMTGYLTSSVITLLNYRSTAEGIQGYTMWGMGDFGGVSRGELPLFAALTAAGLLLAVLLVKPLNIIQLGADYAASLGVNVRRTRNLLLGATGLLAATVTAYCGPVSFIGMAVPHIARMVWRTSDQRVMMPGCMVTGAAVGLLCNLLSVMYPTVSLPLNAVTPLVGVPVILYVIFSERRQR